MIPCDRYCTQEAFDRENREFWPHQWVCVGTTLQLKEHDDFLTATVGGRSVVVQNIDGEIRAFTNVCSHRFNRLQTDAEGNRPLICRYHGWGYDCDGVPNRIPSRPRFDGIDPVCHALQRWHVETVGTLVFVSLKPVAGIESLPAGIVEQSLAFCELCDVNRMLVNCNWKLFVENTLEAYHVPWVHQKSIMQFMGNETGFEFEGNHSSVKTLINDKRLESLFPDRPYKSDYYHHQLIWPNCTLATTRGMSFALQLFEPLGPGSTLFTSLTFSTPGVSPAYGQMAAAMNRRIFDEDRQVCEPLQGGVADAVRPGVLSDEEERVQRFHQCYMRALP